MTIPLAPGVVESEKVTSVVRDERRGVKLKFVGYSLSLTRGVEAPLFCNVLYCKGRTTFGPARQSFWFDKNAFPTRIMTALVNMNHTTFVPLNYFVKGIP